MYLKAEQHPKFNVVVRDIQMKLNQARFKAEELVRSDKVLTCSMLMQPHYFQKIHHLEYVPSGWNIISADGLFGKETENAVKCLQKFLYISVNGFMGDYTYALLLKLLESQTTQSFLKRTNANHVRTSYNVLSTSINVTSKIVGNFDETAEIKTLAQVRNAFKAGKGVNALMENKSIAYVFSEWSKALSHHEEWLRHRISQIPEKKKLRVRNLMKHMDKAKQFIEDAQKKGINAASVNIFGDLTKEKVKVYFKDIADLIAQSNVTKVVKSVTSSIAKIKKIIKPIIDCINKVPGLKYFSIIEKICKGVINLFQCDFEQALSFFLDALREMLETMLIDLSVIALVAAGGWLALVVALVIIIGAMFADYFIFYDNPGDSLADKYTPLHTRNFVREGASWLYNAMY